MRSFIFILIILSNILSSCLVKNLAKGKNCPEFCDKHHKLSGKKAIVKTRYGKLKDLRGYEYSYAKKPHAMGCMTPVWPIGRFAKIYVCDSCTFLYKKQKSIIINESW